MLTGPDIRQLTETWFGDEIDDVAAKCDVARDELAAAVAGDLDFWCPTEHSFVDDDVVIVIASPEELDVADDLRHPVQSVHNQAAARITADSDWDVVEQCDVYVAPTALEGWTRTSNLERNIRAIETVLLGASTFYDIRSLLSTIAAEDDWAARMAPHGDEWLLDDGTSVWVGALDGVARTYAFIGKGREFAGFRLTDDRAEKLVRDALRQAES